MFVALKPLSQRAGIDQVMAGLRRKLAVVPGARLFLVPIQDIRVGGRQSNAAYQYTLQADSTDELYEWAPKLLAALEHNPVLPDVNSDQQQKGLETDLVIDRATASRLGVNASQIDNTLYDAFGQRQVSTIYSAQNQYHVVMEVAPRYWQSPETLKDIYVSTSGGGASGTETTNAVIGTVTAVSAARSRQRPTMRHRGQHRQQFGAQRGDQCAGQYRQGQRLIRRRGQHQQGDDGAAGGLHQIRTGQHAAGGQPPGAVRRHHDFVQSGARQVAERRDRGGRRGDATDRHAGEHPRQLPGHRADLPGNR